jgi:hypothetical protein
MKIPISLIEQVTNYKVKKNSKSLGIDLATCTGVALIKSNCISIDIDYSILQFSNQKAIRYEQVVDFFKILIQDNTFIVIEDTYFNRLNPQCSLLLSRLGGIPLCLSILKKDQNVDYAIIGATSARSKIGMNPKLFPKGKAKECVIKWINDKFGLNIKNDNEADATVLGILGILEGLDFRSQTLIKKSITKKAKKRK